VLCVLLLLLLLVLLQCLQHMLHDCQVAVHGGDMQHCINNRRQVGDVGG
jgi:hypothetical protein